MKPASPHTATIALNQPLFRGQRALRIALVGLPNSGKSTFFAAVASTSVQKGELSDTRRAYNECAVQIGLDEARVIDLPSIRSPHHLESADRAALKYLLWGDERPPVSLHEPAGPPAPFAPPNVIVQVIDATSLEHHLELTLKLVNFGRPLVIALNKMDEADGPRHLRESRRAERTARRAGRTHRGHHGPWHRGVVPRGRACRARRHASPHAQPPSEHIAAALAPLAALLSTPEILQAFRVPPPLLVSQIAEGDPYFLDEMQQHFPGHLPQVRQLRRKRRSGAASAIGRRAACRSPPSSGDRCSRPRPGSAHRAKAAAGATGSMSCS